MLYGVFARYADWGCAVSWARLGAQRGETLHRTFHGVPAPFRRRTDHTAKRAEHRHATFGLSWNSARFSGRSPPDPTLAPPHIQRSEGRLATRASPGSIDLRPEERDLIERGAPHDSSVCRTGSRNRDDLQVRFDLKDDDFEHGCHTHHRERKYAGAFSSIQALHVNAD
jgi:hypothetical protein